MENQECEIIELEDYQPGEIEEQEETAEEKTGMGTGTAILIGVGITVAGIATWKFAKRKCGQALTWIKALRAGANKPNKNERQDDDSEDFVDVDVNDEITK